jgi:tRNA(Ile)-lysidine synthase
MHKFVRSLITEWRRLGLPLSNETVVVAVSGGADSLSLLLAIHDLGLRKKLSLRVVVAHFNHKLRGAESDGDEAFVRDISDGLSLEFVRGSRALARKGNLEQNAREARYAFLRRTAVAVGAAAVLTAHTKNDQAETFLMNLIRGSGADGLAGMRPTRSFGASRKIQLARPLLSWASRKDTEEFCDGSGVKYRNDAMNDDEGFTRVRIRKTLIPLLAEFNPKIVDTLANTSQLLRASGSPGDDTGGRLLANSTRTELVLKEIRTLPIADLREVLRAWLRTARGNLRSLELKHIEAVERLILSRKSGKTVELPGGGRVVKQGGRLVFANIKVEK